MSALSLTRNRFRFPSALVVANVLLHISPIKRLDGCDFCWRWAGFAGKSQREKMEATAQTLVTGECC